MNAKRKQELEAEYNHYIEEWFNENFNNNCFYHGFKENCSGKYTKRLAFNILECGVCGSKLVNFTFKEWIDSKRSGIKALIRQYAYRIEDISIDITRLTQEKRKLRSELKQLRKELKKWC